MALFHRYGEEILREVSFRVETKPIAKGRPRYVFFGGNRHAYTPKKTADYEALIADQYMKMADYYKYGLDVPLIVSLSFGLPIPKSTPKSRREAMNDGLIRHMKKPDVDNLVKAVLDALNGVAWEDDSQIVRVCAEKFYSKDPYIYIRIRESVD